MRFFLAAFVFLLTLHADTVDAAILSGCQRRHDDHHRVALRPVAVVRMKMTWVDACALATLRQALFSLMLAAA